MRRSMRRPAVCKRPDSGPWLTVIHQRTPGARPAPRRRSHMKIGLGLPQIGRFADVAALVEVAVTAEAAGFSSLWTLDRQMAPTVPRTPYPASPDGVLPPEQSVVLDPLLALATAAAHTRRIA